VKKEKGKMTRRERERKGYWNYTAKKAVWRGGGSEMEVVGSDEEKHEEDGRGEGRQVQ